MLCEGLTVRDKSENREASQEATLVIQMRDDRSLEIVNFCCLICHIFGSTANRSCSWIGLRCEAKRGMGTVGLSNWGTVAITDTGKVW